MKVRAGFESNGLPGGKRDLREKKNMIKNNMFRDPFKLILGIIMIVYTFVTVLIRDVLFRRHLKKPKSLKGKVCFVTGSGRGLGREICIALANEGAIIACADINEENNKTTVEILSGMGTKAMGYTLNVAKRLEVEAVAKQVETDLGNVFLLVNNAAIVLPCIEPDEDQVRAVFNVNTIGPIWTTTTFLDKMKKENAGHIVNISSLAAAYGTVSAPLYGASKAALTSYAQAVRLTLKSEGYNNIFVTTVHPGLINTSADYMDLIDSRLPVHEPEYVARFVLKAVKYNTGDVSPQPFLFLFALLGNMAPVAVVERCMQLMDVTLTLPTLEEYKKLPMGDIIQKSNNGELPTEDSLLTSHTESEEGPAPKESVASRIPVLKPVKRNSEIEPENEDLLFFRSLLPYITSLPLVQRLSLRSEINTAVIRAWERRRHQPNEEEGELNRGDNRQKPSESCQQ